jgi:biopolymer transport protein ExbD
MRFRATETEEEGEVQMAPLIDCVFILLIFFLVTSMLQKPHKDLGIVLPVAANAEQATAQADTIVIEVTAPRPPHGEAVIVMDGEEMTQTLMHKRLRMLVLKDADRRVRLDADREAKVEDVTRLLDLLQFEGLPNVGVRTRD